MPSLLAGVGLLPLVYAVARRSFGTTAAVISLALTACCEPLIAYSSEARGYALATLAGVAGYALIPRPNDPRLAAARRAGLGTPGRRRRPGPPGHR